MTCKIFTQGVSDMLYHFSLVRILQQLSEGVHLKCKIKKFHK